MWILGGYLIESSNLMFNNKIEGIYNIWTLITYGKKL